jgi:putative addiction module killer protein
MQVRQTHRFNAWFEELRDVRARARIQARIDRLSLGNPGVRPVGSGVSELRIDYGPGYRVYFVQRGEDLIVLLAGGKKDTQARDIAQAITLASEL